MWGTALARLSCRVITMPTTEMEQKEVKNGFYQKARFPNCIGAVDCTHVKIQSPGGNNAECLETEKVFSQ
jgi:hypothetical protein